MSKHITYEIRARRIGYNNVYPKQWNFEKRKFTNSGRSTLLFICAIAIIIYFIYSV